MWDVWCATLNLCHKAIRIRIHVTCRIVCRHPAFGRRLVGCPEENPLILAAFLRFLSAPGRNQTWVHNRGQLDRDVQHGSFTYNSHPKKFPFQVEHLFFFWGSSQSWFQKHAVLREFTVFFSARFWCIFNCNQARWSKHVGWFFWDWCAPMFFLEDGNTWKMFRICRIGGVCYPKSALMLVDFPCQACEAWTWQAFGIRRAGAHCCLYTSCFYQLVSLPWQYVKLYVFVTCLCVWIFHQVMSLWWFWHLLTSKILGPRWIQSLELSCAANRDR